MPVLHPALQRAWRLESALLPRNPEDISDDLSALDILLLVVDFGHDGIGREGGKGERAANVLAQGTHSIIAQRLYMRANSVRATRNSALSR